MKPQTAIVQIGLDQGFTPREVAAVNLVAFVESVGKNLPDEQLKHNALTVVDALIVAATEEESANTMRQYDGIQRVRD